MYSMSDWFSAYGFADIEDGLLVGAYPLDEDDVSTLEFMRIERVLNLVEDEEYAPGEHESVAEGLYAAGIEEYRLSFTDYGRLPAPQLEGAVTEVVEWLAEGRRVYLHCRAGWQRSAAVAAGVVALREGVGIEDALELVRRRKPSAEPLPEQRDDLLHWWAERDRGWQDDEEDPAEGDEGWEDGEAPPVARLPREEVPGAVDDAGWRPEGGER
jgi:protein-tyrosine phosphatase